MLITHSSSERRQNSYTQLHSFPESLHKPFSGLLPKFHESKQFLSFRFEVVVYPTFQHCLTKDSQWHTKYFADRD